jgi:nitroreductase
MFIDLERKRRSIRKYTDKAIEPEIIDTLIEAALRAPSSRANNPWEFVVVRDRSLIQKLAKAKPAGAGFVAGAPLVIVVCADTEKSDVWVEDASIASTMILFAAESADLGACWVQIRNRPHDDDAAAEEYIRTLLKLPDRVAVLSIMALGYPDESHPPHPKDELLYNQVHDTQYGNAWRKPADSQ